MKPAVGRLVVGLVGIGALLGLSACASARVETPSSVAEKELDQPANLTSPSEQTQVTRPSPSLTATLAPSQQQIVIELPAAGSTLPNPFQLVGRVALTPPNQALSYQIKDGAGALIGSGLVAVQGEPDSAGVFSATVAYSTSSPGLVRIEVIAPNGSTGIEAQIPTLTVNLQPGLRLNLNGVATRAQADIVPRVNNTRFPIDWNGAPEHVRVLFDDDQPTETFDPRTRQLLILPMDEYKALFREADAQSFAQTIETFQTRLNTQPATAENTPLLLPASGLTPVLQAQVRYLNFGNGRGVRFITHLTQEIGLLTASSFIYTFQGLTNDGRYYVSAYIPISATVLPATAADVPAEQRAAFKKDYLAYIDSVAQTLNAQPERMNPSLAALDAMITSLQIGDDVLGRRAQSPVTPPSNAQAITGVATELLNIRAGPGTRFRAVGRLAAGENAVLVGRSADGAWIRVRAEDGTLGWVSRAYVESSADFNELPVEP